uniref:Putative KpsF/GutQ n=1 Tax=uncultured marine Nitrospinaceae bacterium TaxID=482920 RepID=A4GJ53_9BACT|nr:putative KpsF/GutQ [uncultured marine Nitrospinaceae bacterium]
MKPSTKKRVLQDSAENQDAQSIIETARKVLDIESLAIAELGNRIDDQFVNVVHHLNQCKHLVITGVGKSGLIGKKISSTFSSIGLPSLFLHASEASHGDLGMISEGDTVIAISNSGETDEVVKLLPIFNRIKCTLVGMTGNMQSSLAKRSDYVLDVSVKVEACSKDLVPTASTTATLAMGDALAMAFMELRGVQEEDFALNHPGGNLGRKLLTLVDDLMHSGEDIPRIKEDADIYQVLKEISQKRLGMTLVVGDQGQLLGIITDGDLRRLIEKQKDISQSCAKNMMGGKPKTITRDTLATKAVRVMQDHAITSLAVISDDRKIEGIIHLHDILKAGVV